MEPWVAGLISRKETLPGIAIQLRMYRTDGMQKRCRLPRNATRINEIQELFVLKSVRLA